jgi:hypothetical protein
MATLTVPNPNLKLDIVLGKPFVIKRGVVFKDGDAKFQTTVCTYDMPGNWMVLAEPERVDSKTNRCIVARDMNNTLRVVVVDYGGLFPMTNLWN